MTLWIISLGLFVVLHDAVRVRGSTMVLLSRTLMDTKTQEPTDEERTSRERSLIISAITSTHHLNQSRRYQGDDDDDDDYDRENRFMFFGSDYALEEKREAGESKRGGKTGRGRGGSGRVKKGLEIDLEIRRGPAEPDAARKALKQDRLRRQESARPASASSEIDASSSSAEETNADHVIPVHEYLSPLNFLVAMESTLTSDCPSPASGVVSLRHEFPPSLHEIFANQTNSLVQIANVLNNLFAKRTGPEVDQSADHKTALYYSLVRAVVDSHDLVSTAAIVFERTDTKVHQTVPFAYRNRTTGHIHVKDLANVSQAASTRDKVAEDSRWSYPSLSHFLSLSSTSAESKTVRCLPSATLFADTSDQQVNVSRVVTHLADGRWSRPYFDCAATTKLWVITYSVPFYGCTNSDPNPRGVISIEIDLYKVDINQCPGSGGVFDNSHRCQPSTTCVHLPKYGFRRGGYRCDCKPGFYFPSTGSHRSSGQLHRYFDGTEVEKTYLSNLTRSSESSRSASDFACLQCADGCETCVNETPCLGSDDFIVSVIALALQSFTMTSTLLAAVVVIRLRHTKVMKDSFWVLLEIIIAGALMMYTTVAIQYVNPSNVTCILVPWFREVGFVIVYGSLTLKVYRVLAEFQSRKAQRILLRNKDLLKYLAAMIIIVIGYMITWTVINVDHIWNGATMVHVEHRTNYLYCSATWWDYVIEIEEFLFLLGAIYICYRVRTAPSFYLESKYISWAIYNETALSAIFNIVRHCLWLIVNPNYLYWMYFFRCQLTVTVTLLLVIGTKVWYTHRPPDDAICRRRTYSTTDAQEASAPEATKLAPCIGYSVGAGGGGATADGDIGDINLSDMNPDDIRSELKRLYTQLQIYKTKSMRKDNPHISKRRGGRKPTHRRFSLQAFHHHNKHKLQQGAEGISGEHENEASRSPEESTNSVDVVPGGVALAEGDSCTGGVVGGEVRARSTSLSSRVTSGHR